MSSPARSLSLIERVLFLRQVSLFADLPPADLERVASIADERSYTDGDVVAAQGELGQELYIVMEGTLRVHAGAGWIGARAGAADRRRRRR